MFVIFWLLSLAQASSFAWDNSGGLTGVGIAVRSSAGNHRIHSGLGGWYQHCTPAGSIQRCWIVQVDMAGNGQSIPGGVMRSFLVRPTGMMGYVLGQEATKVGFSFGPSVQVLLGGADESVTLIQPGGYGQISIQKPLGGDWLLSMGNGYLLRLYGVDVDLSVGIGRRW